MVRVPAREAGWLGAQSGGEGLCESLLSPRRPQASWVKGGCSPPASPPTWAQTMSLCARRGRVVKVRSPGPEPWPRPPRGQGGRARGAVGARKCGSQGSEASLTPSQQRKLRHREGAPGTQGHSIGTSEAGREPGTPVSLLLWPEDRHPAARGQNSLLLKPALRGSAG